MANEERRFTRATLSKNNIPRTYARLARIYDPWAGLTEGKALDMALRLASIRDGETILEVAVGTGLMFRRIVSANPNGRSEGVDLSPGMLAKAERRLNESASSYSLQVADAYSLPFADSTFDLLINNYMIDLMPEQDFPHVLAEFKRVLKPGGRTVITTMTPGRSWYSRIWDRLLRKFPDILGGCRPIILTDDLSSAGFVNIRGEYVSQLSFPSLVTLAEKPA